ncbi:hypothetical protein GF380_02995 [Candidatus Uhrbacteria bacterium]|nr:hypothetical protein [Candidatus Uhrbacteria bacterium]MBD3284115.1 hypothetical protein [Candidatus Uhrbacteria bacterium]
MREQPTTQELLESIQSFADSMDERFDHVDQRFDALEDHVKRVEIGLSSVVTKDDLDDKLVDHGAQYGMLIRQTNKKIDALTDALISIGSLPVQAARRISGMEPFGST